ncbi:unnamed protein product [Lathyrus oleraceus]|uniref:AT-hook motif nuclear-localized protein 28-like n=1 Tax=Pisum sativum TaxID=3888 RepID=UPI001FC4C2FD|nr:AT-hook motif nuclear-localized protein 28-like [Pisum sativum]
MADNVFSPSPSFSRCISQPQESSEDLSIQPSKRSKGRPKGSKNKPKPPSIIKVEPETYMEPILIEIPAGEDVVESIIKTAWRHQADISVLRGFGLVSGITLLDSPSQNSPFTIRGECQMISLSGTYVYPNSDRVPSEFIVEPDCSSFSIHLSGNHGQVFGGVVGGRVMASSVVMVTATLLRKPKFYRVASFDGSVREVEKTDRGAIVRNDAVALVPEHSNHNNTANVFNYGVGSSSSAQLNRQVLNAPHAYVNAMQWNNSRTNIH